MKNICCFTGTRAEYGLLKPLMSAISDDSTSNLQLIVSGMHLSPEFGLTYTSIEEDGFKIDAKVEMLLSSDSPVGISKSIGLGIAGISDVLESLDPYMFIVLGDRFETFAAATAAHVARIPLVHLYGGETTQGALDEAFRHAITKMSQIHFVSTEKYRQRVVQLGEAPESVFNVGSIGVENIRKINLLERAGLEKDLDFTFGEKNMLVTFHPATMLKAPAGKQFENLLNAIDKVSDLKIIFTKANADTDGRIINQLIDRYIDENQHKSIAFTSMGQLRYLSCMQFVDAVVGNSSSGIIETPSFGIPTVNIGTRQAGREKAASIIDCEPTSESIHAACQLAFSNTFKDKASLVVNPYEKNNTVKNIVDQLRNIDISSTEKIFYDLPESCFDED